MFIGIAGTDENKRITQAQAGLGLAGEIKGQTLAGASFGVSGLNDRHIIAAGEQATRFGISGLGSRGNISAAAVGVAGPNTRQIITSASSAVGVAGNLGSATRQRAGQEIVDVSAFQRRDEALAAISRESNRLGDRSAREGWQRGVWFADFTYICHSGRGRQVGWRKDREIIFGRDYRSLPLYLDSCAFRREITGTAPKWAHSFETYQAAIELLDPDGYAAWDYPQDRARTMDHLHRLIGTFPADVASGRMWPVFSVRWAWSDQVHLDFARLPGWGGKSLAALIPLTRTQRQVLESTREKWARQAIANALKLAVDQDFLWMVNTFGRVMIGGMVTGPCPRSARHLFAATLCHLFPGVQFWLLGQANFAVVNGLGRMGLLDQVWTDGTWWIRDSTAERFAIIEDGLITMLSLETEKDERQRKGIRRQSFFTLTEMMAANLRSLLGAYQGLWSWPPPEPLPVDLLDAAQALELKERYQHAQLELGL